MRQPRLGAGFIGGQLGHQLAGLSKRRGIPVGRREVKNQADLTLAQRIAHVRLGNELLQAGAAGLDARDLFVVFPGIGLQRLGKTDGWPAQEKVPFQPASALQARIHLQNQTLDLHAGQYSRLGLAAHSRQGGVAGK